MRNALLSFEMEQMTCEKNTCYSLLFLLGYSKPVFSFFPIGLFYLFNRAMTGNKEMVRLPISVMYR